MLVSSDILNRVSRENVLKIDMETGKVRNQTTGVDFDVEPMSDYVLDILRMGGIKPLVKRYLKENKAE